VKHKPRRSSLRSSPGTLTTAKPLFFHFFANEPPFAIFIVVINHTPSPLQRKMAIRIPNNNAQSLWPFDPANSLAWATTGLDHGLCPVLFGSCKLPRRTLNPKIKNLLALKTRPSTKRSAFKTTQNKNKKYTSYLCSSAPAKEQLLFEKR